MPSILIQTLGCKLNQLESEAMAASFKRAGFTLTSSAGEEKADLILINTCTVTSRAEQKARRLIRQALRENPAARVIVTGCYAQMEGAAIAALGAALRVAPEGPGGGGRLLVAGEDRKPALMALPDYLAGRSGDLDAALSAWQGAFAPVAGPGAARGAAQEAVPWAAQGAAQGAAQETVPRAALETVPRADPFVFRPEDFSFHSRAFLKIQDGCNQGCSFCRSVLARGKSRSLNADEALERLRALEEGGFAEAVITGLNIGQYRDPGRGLDLGGLLRFLLEGTARITLRLSSLEPDGLGGGFFELLSNRRIRPHFHLSVQSGSQAVLNRMGRRYSPADIEALTAEFRRLKDDPFLAADIIAGFPGETPEDFKATLELCERTGFAWIHAFPYSPRPGTPAYDFGGRVGNGEAASRVEALLDLARRGRAVYIGRWLGRTVEAVVRAGGLPPGFDAAVSENYLNLLLRREPGEGPLRPGARLRCRIAPLPELPGAGRFDAAGLACVC